MATSGYWNPKYWNLNYWNPSIWFLEIPPSGPPPTHEVYQSSINVAFRKNRIRKIQKTTIWIE